ncbi:MAG: hypothetical protein WCG44_01265 [bacterium]
MKLKTIAIAAVYVTLVFLVIRATPTSEALLHDAGSYYHATSSIWTNTFIDRGYVVALSLIMRLVGGDNIIALQIANYLFWLVSCWLIYKSLTHLGAKHSKLTSLLMVFSPLYLTFSAKLYSEPFAALGVSLLLYGVSAHGSLALLIGSVILGSTKSLFIPGIILLAFYYLFRREFKRFVPLLFGTLILIPVFVSSLGGGRSLYNLAVERAKLDQSYDQILSCVPYYLSYPLGVKLLPQYEGVCHQNDPDPSMIGYQSNPYIRAVEIRAKGFTYLDWWQGIVQHPVKYVLVFIVGLFNLVLFEGVYPSILLQMSPWLIPIIFIVTKLALVSYLWLKVIKVGKRTWSYLFPLIYLVIMVGNFQVEPRYIYPLIPYIYFLVGL